MAKLIELIFTGVAAMTSMLGVLMFWVSQSAIQDGQMWPRPRPGLVLLV